MKLKSIELQNFRCYENLKIELDKSFNIIVGINGTGKTVGGYSVKSPQGMVRRNIIKWSKYFA